MMNWFFGYGGSRAFRNLTIALGLLMAGGAGFGAGLKAQAAPQHLIAFGDSLTAGYGLGADEGLVPQLEAWLKAHGADVRVENAGVSGDTSAGGLSRIDWALSGGGDAIMITLGGNDMLRGLPPAQLKENLSAIVAAAKAKDMAVLLVALQAPGNWGADYKQSFDATYGDLAAAEGVALAPDFFAGLRALGADPSDPASLARYMQADGIHPNAEGVKHIVEGLGPQVLALLSAAKAAP